MAIVVMPKENSMGKILSKLKQILFKSVFEKNRKNQIYFISIAGPITDAGAAGPSIEAIGPKGK